jgi:diguanylate cyclase (GGDEF)-like protein
VAVFGGGAVWRLLSAAPSRKVAYQLLGPRPTGREDLRGFHGALVELGPGLGRASLRALRDRLDGRAVGSLSRSVDATALRRSSQLGFDFHLGAARRGDPPPETVVAHLEAARSTRRVVAAGRSMPATERLAILSDIVRTANSILEPRQVTELIMAQIQRLLPSEAWSLLLVDEAAGGLKFEMALGVHGTDVSDLRVEMGEGIAGWVAQTGKPTIVNDVARDRRFSPKFDTSTNFVTHSILCAPLISRGHTIGVVEIINRKGGRFTKADLDLLLTLVEPCAIALENAMLFQRAERLTVTDDLTQLFNSRYLTLYLDREIKRCKRHGIPLSLIFLDLDGFKEVNDRHGHLAGSSTLTEVGRILNDAVRESDILARYGGDEFVVVLPETPASGAQVIAERIRLAIEGHPFLERLDLAVNISASFGIASYPDHALTPGDLIRKADQAMYRVKERNKNGVELAV